MRRSIVAGNWKMNGDLQQNRQLLEAIRAGVNTDTPSDVVVCPAFPHISQTAELLEPNKLIAWGAQNLDYHRSGAYTGEVSAAMLVDLGCEYVIVGHSERRAIYGEANELVAKKTEAALASELIPIICVGETLEEREADETETIIARQLDAVLEIVDIQQLAKTVIAYEPVWAIGTGKTATPDQAQQVHQFIRNKLAGLDAATAEGLRILYGGSVKPANAEELFQQQDIDGGLIGGAALNADDFLAICRAA